jgi:hypothetical protein
MAKDALGVRQVYLDDVPHARPVAQLCMLRSVPFGKYWRSSPLMFSLVPRCHGL